MILPKQNHEEAMKVAEYLRASVAALAIKHNDNNVTSVTISSGVATFYPDDNGDADWKDVVKQADDALYKAKAGKKNCVYSA